MLSLTQNMFLRREGRFGRFQFQLSDINNSNYFTGTYNSIILQLLIYYCSLLILFGDFFENIYIGRP